MTDTNLSIQVLEGLVVRPGDTLILSFDRHLTDAEYTRIREDLRACLPGIANLAVVEGASAMAVYRPDVFPPIGHPDTECRCGDTRAHHHAGFGGCDVFNCGCPAFDYKDPTPS